MAGTGELIAIGSALVIIAAIILLLHNPAATVPITKSTTLQTTSISTTTANATISVRPTTVPQSATSTAYTTSENSTTSTSTLTTTVNQNLCTKLSLNANSPNATSSGTCYWNGGNMSIYINNGQFSSTSLKVTSPYGFSLQSYSASAVNVSYCTTSNPRYNLSSGLYTIALSTGGIGDSCLGNSASLNVKQG